MIPVIRSPAAVSAQSGPGPTTWSSTTRRDEAFSKARRRGSWAAGWPGAREAPLTRGTGGHRPEGGLARAKALSAEELASIAPLAARARWDSRREGVVMLPGRSTLRDDEPRARRGRIIKRPQWAPRAPARNRVVGDLPRLGATYDDLCKSARKVRAETVRRWVSAFSHQHPDRAVPEFRLYHGYRRGRSVRSEHGGVGSRRFASPWSRWGSLPSARA